MPGLAVVTGASSGIGEAYAERLAADGWDLIVVARREERLRDLAARLTQAHPVSVRAVQADLARSDELQRVCDEIAEAPVDMLVNNAGLAHYKPFAELPPAQARELIDLNIMAPVLLTRVAVTGMLARSRGAIINIASLLAFSGAAQAAFLPQRAVYAGTKASLADLAAGVVVSVPGLADTEALTHLDEASRELVSVARTADLPDRYAAAD